MNRYVTVTYDYLQFQGTTISQLERDIGSDQFPPNEHYFGLVNVSVTLYPMKST